MAELFLRGLSEVRSIGKRNLVTLLLQNEHRESLALIWFHIVQSGDPEEMGNNSHVMTRAELEAAVGLADFDFNRMLAGGFQKVLRHIDISRK